MVNHDHFSISFFFLDSYSLAHSVDNMLQTPPQALFGSAPVTSFVKEMTAVDISFDSENR